ncbi:transposase [Variovorax saccharolyticus]|uniref:transposase n=1 Tax=Variovorax saccharolyticus TaxID=3053516 RepID=UPI002576103F|nr:transposase [Variovorax sp. J31P216]MDM0028324.1 transposase [Variovorax sp. J31P216]
MYDEAAKSELVALCRQPGASVSRLARECGVNANQVGRWLREQGHGGRPRKAVASELPAPATFVAVSLPPAEVLARVSFRWKSPGPMGPLCRRRGDQAPEPPSGPVPPTMQLTAIAFTSCSAMPS